MEDNFKLKQAGKYFLIALWVMLTIITCAAIWNAALEPFVLVSSILLFISNGFIARKLIRWVSKEK